MLTNNHLLEFTGERMVPGSTDNNTFLEHVYRYHFSARFVKNKRVLDIACGEGYGTAGLLLKGASSVIGIDISQEACKHAKLKYGIDLCIGDALNIPLPNCAFDLIVSFETIEHLEDAETFILECHRLLAPKGKLIISTPNKGIYDAVNEPNEFHQNEMTKTQFIGLLGKHFKKIQIYSQQPQKISWLSLRPLSRADSPWLKVRGLWRIRQTLIKIVKYNLDLVNTSRLDPVVMINKSNHLLSFLVNPYMVVKDLIDEKPIYYLVVADK